METKVNFSNKFKDDKIVKEFGECKMLTELPKNADFSNPPNINIFENIDEGQRKLKEYLSTFKVREGYEE